MSGHLTGWRLSAGDEHTVFDGQQRKIATIACGGMSGRTFAESAEVARLIASAPELLSIVQRFVALPSGAWHPERHAADEAELFTEAKAAIAKAIQP